MWSRSVIQSCVAWNMHLLCASPSSLAMWEGRLGGRAQPTCVFWFEGHVENGLLVNAILRSPTLYVYVCGEGGAWHDLEGVRTIRDADISPRPSLYRIHSLSPIWRDTCRLHSLPTPSTLALPAYNAAQSSTHYLVHMCRHLLRAI